MLPAEGKTRRGSVLLLSFAVPFVFVTLLCVFSGGAPLAVALPCGALVGGFFLVSWFMAARVSHSQGGQVMATILFFIGGIGVVAALVLGGCMFLMRGF